LLVDLLQRTVALLIIAASMQQPVAVVSAGCQRPLLVDGPRASR
jgi:hypothetical protein